MKRKESKWAIHTSYISGPSFGNGWIDDIYIPDRCNIDKSCYINNNGKMAYECHPEYQKSLFTNTGCYSRHRFSVEDYEVFSVDFLNEKKSGDKSIGPNCVRKYDVDTYISDEVTDYYDMLEEDYIQVSNNMS